MINRTHAFIDIHALQHNIDHIQQLAPNAPIIAMVKANAYGHSVERIAPALVSSVAGFGVACLLEARQLRQIAPNTPILLMAGIFSSDEWAEIFSLQLDVIIHQPWQAESLLSYRGLNSTRINVWLKVDTGMNRLGVAPEQVSTVYKILQKCPHIHSSIHLMTHFACADETQNEMTIEQSNRFQSIINTLQPSPSIVSLANSAAIIAWPQTHATFVHNPHLNYIRPGIMLYGISPFADKTGADLNLKPVMSLRSHIISIKLCSKGETVGYDATWRATRDSRIAIVCIGYGDGYPRHINQDAVVWIDDHYYPIVGRVSMDMMTIDISNDNNNQIQIGTSVELWGNHLPVEKVAQFAGTSPYELVTQVCHRCLV